VARRVFVHVYGTKLGPVSSIPFSLRKRVKGIGLPSIANRKGVGVGVSWDGQVPLGDQASASAFWNSFPKRPNGFGLEVAYSPLDPDSDTLISPGTDLGERAGDGWFNNVAVRSPEQESSDIKAQRLSYSIGSVWNQGTVARGSFAETVSKALEVTAETGGSRDGWGARGSVRLQSIREAADKPFLSRSVAQLTVKPPDWPMGRDIRAVARGDAFGAASERNRFGWARFEAGLIYQPSKPFRFGAAWVTGGSTGNPDFDFDRLYSRSAVHFRADWTSGPYTARYLAKYDLDRKLWYDREYELAIVANVFEPYILFREFPADTRFGVRFRLDGLVDKLKQRRQSR
jgi:hypothetical protein